MKIRINHPKADTISIINHDFAYAGPNSVEIAFFWRGQWVIDHIEPFADYHDGSDSDTAVYPWVPVELVDAFLAENGI